MNSSICFFVIIVFASIFYGSESIAANSTIRSHVHREICSNLNSTHQKAGKCIWSDRSLECHESTFNFTNIKSGDLSRTRCIFLCRWPLENFDLSTLERFPRLNTIHFEHGTLTRLNGEFPSLKHLKHINISHTRLVHLDSSVFRKLSAIKMVDLRWNQLDYYDGTFFLPTKHARLYLSENPFDCSKNFKWINNRSKYIADLKLLQCNDSSFKNKSIITVMDFKTSLQKMCQQNVELQNCTCSLSYIGLDSINNMETWRPMYSINCSNLNLYRLPTSVPENTAKFYAQHNQISDLDPLLHAYRSVHDIYLDYNKISSIESLETGNFLEHFGAFSLKGNELTRLPVYSVNNALEVNHQAHVLLLSENPWTCECKFMLRFQDLLQSHRNTITDASQIQCREIVGDELVFRPVLGLKISDVCTMPSEDAIFQKIDILNGVLALLIAFIAFKLCYDYYNFRMYGQLPWIVTKMP